MYNGVVIGDIHNGVTKDDRIHNEINEVFIYHISSMEKLDFIITNLIQNLKGCSGFMIKE